MIVKHRPGSKLVYFHNSDLESELKSAVVFLVRWEAGERIFGIFDPHKAQMRRLLDRWAKERKKTKEGRKPGKQRFIFRKCLFLEWELTARLHTMF